MKKLMFIFAMLIGAASACANPGDQSGNPVRDSDWKKIQKEHPVIVNVIEFMGDSLKAAGKFLHENSNIVKLGTKAFSGTYNGVSGAFSKATGTVKSGYDSGKIQGVASGLIGLAGIAVVGGVGYYTGGALINKVGNNWFTYGGCLIGLDIALGRFVKDENNSSDQNNQNPIDPTNPTQKSEFSLGKALLYVGLGGLALGTVRQGSLNLFEKAKDLMSDGVAPGM